MATIHCLIDLLFGNRVMNLIGSREVGIGHRACLMLVLLLGLVIRADALTFSTIQDERGRNILQIYDCNAPGMNPPRCLERERGFTREGDGYRGDAAELDSLLRTQRFAEVNLYSGGGDLEEGIKVGEVLRRYRQYVRVRSGTFCVSACTVAFLGGVVRDVDPGGKYMVHAYSRVTKVSADALAPMQGERGESLLIGTARESNRRARYFARRLVLYVQRMIGGEPNDAAVEAVLSQAEDFAANYESSGRWQVDLARIRSGGAPAGQEILMRIERESFESYLSALKSQGGALGARGIRAIDILEIMFSSRITGTAALDQNTLKEYGYINVRR